MTIGVIGVLVYLGLRLHNLDSIPLFIDEAIHIEWSEDVKHGALLQHAWSGRLLLPYYLLAFQPAIHAVWVARAALLLVSCVGCAASAAIAGRYGGLKAALLAIMLCGFSPMLFFFDRLVLADTMLHVAITVWVWSLLRAFDRAKPSGALALSSGVIFVVAMGAKATALLLLPLPLTVAWLIATWPVADRIKSIAILYGTFVALWLPFMLILSSRQINYFGLSAQALPTSSALLDVARIIDEIRRLVELVVVYHGAALVLGLFAACAIAVWHRYRMVAVLLLGVVGFALAIASFGVHRLYNRYYVSAAPLLLTAASIASVEVARWARLRFQRDIYPLLVFACAIWIALFSLPFLFQLYHSPASAGLAASDHAEYVANDSSGFGIPELAAYLMENEVGQTEPAVGAFVGCFTLEFYLPADSGVAVECLDVLAGDRRAKYLNRYLPQLAQEQDEFLLVLENPGFVSHEELSGVALTPVAEFPRPGSHSVIQLYLVSALPPG